MPIPERFLGALGAAAVLHIVAPIRLPLPGPMRLVGVSLLAAGAGLAGWAVASAGETSVDRTDALVTTGAYATVRNPMYVGWAASVLGIGLATRSPWLVLLWAHAVRAVHGEVLAEERLLADRFGARYAAYRSQTPRYAPARILPAWPNIA